MFSKFFDWIDKSISNLTDSLQKNAIDSKFNEILKGDKEFEKVYKDYKQQSSKTKDAFSKAIERMSKSSNKISIYNGKLPDEKPINFPDCLLIMKHGKHIILKEDVTKETWNELLKNGYNPSEDEIKMELEKRGKQIELEKKRELDKQIKAEETRKENILKQKRTAKDIPIGISKEELIKLKGEITKLTINKSKDKTIEKAYFNSYKNRLGLIDYSLEITVVNNKVTHVKDIYN